MQKEKNNPLSHLISITSSDPQDYLNLIKFITSSDKQADINKIYYMGEANEISNPNKIKELNEKWPTQKNINESATDLPKNYYTIKIKPASIVETFLTKFNNYSIEQLQSLINDTSIDLTAALETYELIVPGEYIIPIMKNLDGRKALPTQEFNHLLCFPCIEKKPIKTKVISSILFSLNESCATENIEKFKFLLLEIKKQFELKEKDFDLFSQNLIASDPEFFIRSFKHCSQDFLNFLQKELNYGMNTTIDKAPLFFNAYNPKKIDYIIENGADFTLKNFVGQTYADFWSPQPEAKNLLTYLNSKSPEDMDLEKLFFNFLKNSKNISELNAVVSKISKAQKIKDKTEIKIEGQSILFHAVKAKHWKYAYSFLSLHEEEEGFLYNISNEVTSNGYAAFMSLLHDKSNIYDPNDRGGTKRSAMLHLFLDNMNWETKKDIKNFISNLTNTLLRGNLSFMQPDSLNQIFKILTDKFKLSKNENIDNEYKKGKHHTYKTDGSHYSGGIGAAQKELTSYFFDSLNLNSTSLIKIFTKIFIENKNQINDNNINKNNTNSSFANTSGNLLLAMELGEKTFSKTDKKELVKIYIKNLLVFNEFCKKEIELLGTARYNTYSFSFWPVMGILKAFKDYNYPFDKDDIPAIMQLYKYLPLPNSNSSKVEHEEEVISYIEKRAIENILLPSPNNNALADVNKNSKPARLNKI